MNIKVKNIKGLEYGDALVGLRVYLSNRQVWDIDVYTLKEVGLTHFDIQEKIKLKLVGNLLISSDEEGKGENIEDIASNKEAKDFLREVLFTKPWNEKLKGFQMPWKLSLNDFMEDKAWVPERVNRTDEYKNQHTLTQPDGTKWRGGWIGSARSPERAKWNFHKEQVKYALHRGERVADIALLYYPEYIEVKQLINELYSRITHDGQLVHIKFSNGDVKSFNVEEFPKQRYNERGFISEKGLIPDDLKYSDTMDKWFNPRELMCVALGMYIRENVKST